MVTKREEIRTLLAKYYDITTKEAKKLVNALTYGKILENTPGERPHHQLLISYQMAVADAATKLVPPGSQDYEYAKQKNPETTHHRVTFKALSELLNRIEEQTLSCIIQRLVDMWGVNPKTLIVMHDGVLVNVAEHHKERGLARMQDPQINQEVLRDITIYVRKTLNAFVRLTVKKGSDATEITCGVPWPSMKCIDPTIDTESAEELDPKWEGTLVLGKPVRYHMDRSPSPDTPIYNVTVDHDQVNLHNSTGEKATHTKLSIVRAIALRECFQGPGATDEEFSSAAHEILAQSISAPASAMEWALAHHHPELHLWMHETYNIETCLTTPFDAFDGLILCLTPPLRGR